MDWARSFHPSCLEIYLNFSGSGTLQDGVVERQLEAAQVAINTTHPGRPKARRAAGSSPRFLTLEMRREFLRTPFSENREQLKEPVRQFMKSSGKPPAWLEIGLLPASLLSMCNTLLQPPVPEAARAVVSRQSPFRLRHLGYLSQRRCRLLRSWIVSRLRK